MLRRHFGRYDDENFHGFFWGMYKRNEFLLDLLRNYDRMLFLLGILDFSFLFYVNTVRTH